MKYIPIHTFADKKKTALHNIYRFIREGKIDPKDVKKEKVEVIRMRIKEDAKIKTNDNKRKVE